MLTVADMMGDLCLADVSKNATFSQNFMIQINLFYYNLRKFHINISVS